MKKTGFTLIELMVVITIIGILASIVLPNLTTVRGRGQDSAVKEQMSQFRTMAAIYYDDEYGYSKKDRGQAESVGCDEAETIFAEADTQRVIKGITGNAGSEPKCYLGKGAKAQSWAMTVELRGGKYWCVDSAGNSGSHDSDPDVDNDGEVVCPSVE